VEEEIYGGGGRNAIVYVSIIVTGFIQRQALNS